MKRLAMSSAALRLALALLCVEVVTPLVLTKARPHCGAARSCVSMNAGDDWEGTYMVRALLPLHFLVFGWGGTGTLTHLPSRAGRASRAHCVERLGGAAGPA